MKTNYHYSGLSTPEAMKDFAEVQMASMPKPLRSAVKLLLRAKLLRLGLGVVCDGCGVRTQLPENTVLMPVEPRPSGDCYRWRGSEWHHMGRLDFCSTCMGDGTADRAVADGAKPLGKYTMG